MCISRMSENVYTPIFNSEADFQQLWKNPHGAVRCFKEAVDDIYSGSFVFRSFRNEFETDSLFSSHAVELLKKGVINFNSLENDVGEPGTSVYIPGYKVQSFLPSRSELSKLEMKECFPMYEDICNNKTLSFKKLALYNKYRGIIQNEQVLYQDIAKRTWYGVNYRRTNEIKSEVVEYTSKLWQQRLSRLNWYPKHYLKCSDISLIDDSGRTSEMILSKQLANLGYSQYCTTPSLSKNRLNIFSNLDSTENQEKATEDSEQTMYGCKYYKSIHPYLTRKDYHPDVSRDKFAEYLATQNNAKIVMSASSFLCLLDNHPGIGARSWELPILIKEYTEGDSRKKILYIDKVFPPKSLTAVERIKWFCKKKVIGLLKYKKKAMPKIRENKGATSYGNFSNGDTCDISKLECFGIEADSSDKKIEKTRKKVMKSSASTSEEFHSINNASSIDNISNDHEENLFFSSDSDNDLIIDFDEPSTHEKSDFKVITEEKSSSTPNKDSLPQEKKELKDRIIYNLWTMKCETSNVLLKSNLKDLDIIIRCKEGVKFPKQKNYTVTTKLEYQPEFGAEITTLSEITRDWGNTLIRPNCSLLRVRLDPLSGELIMYERKSLHDLTLDFQRLYSKNPYHKLTSLHSLLGELSELSPGNYLLSHSPENGSFARLYREERSKHNYNSNLGYLNINCNTVAPAKGSWLQIDQMVLTPTCYHFLRIPATFHPKVIKNSSKLAPMNVSEKDKEKKGKAQAKKIKRKYQKIKKKKQAKKKCKNTDEVKNDESAN